MNNIIGPSWTVLLKKIFIKPLTILHSLDNNVL